MQGDVPHANEGVTVLTGGSGYSYAYLDSPDLGWERSDCTLLSRTSMEGQNPHPVRSVVPRRREGGC